MNKNNQYLDSLNLEPKINHTLSLWNIKDYFILLYWCFYFPQAILFYLNKNINKNNEKEIRNHNLYFAIKTLINLKVTRELIIHSFLLIIAPWVFLFLGIKFLGYDIALINLIQFIKVILFFALLVSILLFHPLNIKYNLYVAVASFIAYNVVFSITFGIGLIFVQPITLYFSSIVVSPLEVFFKDFIINNFVNGLVSGTIFGFPFGLAFCSALAVKAGIANSLFLVIPFSAISVFITLSVVDSITWNISFITNYLLFSTIAVLRIDDWLLNILKSFSSISQSIHVSHVSIIPYPNIYKYLYNYTKNDWDKSTVLFNQILKFSLQYIPVIKAIYSNINTLGKNDAIKYISKLSESPFDWKLIKFLASNTFLYIAIFLNRKNTELYQVVKNTSAGFWYLNQSDILYLAFQELFSNKTNETPSYAENFLKKSIQNFAKIHHLRYGEELFCLANTINDLRETVSDDILIYPSLPKLKLLKTNDLLRPLSWQAIKDLYDLKKDFYALIKTRSIATRNNIAINVDTKIEHIYELRNDLPHPEKEKIFYILNELIKKLKKIDQHLQIIDFDQPVHNPYIITNPIEEKVLIGRDDILKELEQLWLINRILQSVVLYGHRRMGKTSILRNISNSLGSEVLVAYVNLQNVVNVTLGVGEVLMAITDELAETLNLDPPKDNDLLTLPKRTFERYLKTILKQLGEKRLIIALDEFETLENLIEAGQIPNDFLGFLRGMVQLSPKIAFAFAGLHTLEEMTTDYFQPFYASVIPIHVSFLKPAATRQILANPDDDFPLDYTREALDLIHDRTAGQPLLVQLVGHQLVRLYNDQVFEEGRQRDVQFTVEDVEAVMDDPDFFRKGSSYFEGIWKQAADGAEGQRDILQVLAREREGLTLEPLTQRLPFETSTVQEALKTLQRHDVVQEQEGNWRIIVELFRRWVTQRE